MSHFWVLGVLIKGKRLHWGLGVEVVGTVVSVIGNEVSVGGEAIGGVIDVGVGLFVMAAAGPGPGACDFCCGGEGGFNKRCATTALVFLVLGPVHLSS